MRSKAEFEGHEIFRMKLEPSVLPIHYIAFPFKTKKSGTWNFEWIDDNGQNTR